MFDPLSFFEAVPADLENIENTELSTPTLADVNQQNTNANKSDRVDIDNNSNTRDADDDVNGIPLTMLDLPNAKITPFNILKTILQMFKPDQLKNFGNTDSDTDIIGLSKNEQELSQYLGQKNVSISELNQLAGFINHSVESVLSLSQLPITDSKGLVSYLTKLISYPFPDFTEDQTDEIYDLASFVMTANSAPALKGNSTRLVEITGLPREILLYEPALTEDNIGNITWGASLELAKKIVGDKNLQALFNKELPILELGAGTGLVTIALRMLSYKVVSTDLPEIIPNLSKNLQLNKLNSNSTVFERNDDFITHLDWRSPNEFLDRMQNPNGYQTVLLSDPVYSPQHPYWVRDTIDAVLSKDKNSNVVFMVGKRDRFLDVRENLWGLMLSLGLKLKQSEIIDGFDDYGKLQYDYKVFSWT